MPIWRLVTGFLVLVGCLASSGCYSSDDVTLQGVGATFPAPLYKRWFLEYHKKHPDVRTNYQAIGSGAGIRQFSEGLTDFGASDEFKMPDVAGGAYLIPMTAGSIALAYNLPGGPATLKLSRKTYVNIFLGHITTWSDPAITNDNGQTLPEVDITVIRRAESSGTTYAFTNHLNAISETWKKGSVGKGKSVAWPEGFLGGKGNAGVAALIQQTPGAIGYLELGYAKLAELPMAHLKNKNGKFVPPTAEGGMAALSGPNENKIPADLHIEIADPEGADAYPIVTYTWMITKKKYVDPKAGNTLKQVLAYCLTDGQKINAELDYLPLPDRVREKSLEMVKKIEVGKENVERNSFRSK